MRPGAPLWSAALVVLLYAPAWMRGAMPDRGEEDLRNFYAEKEAVVERYRRGEIPLWNPRIGLGVPLVSGQETPFYPPNLLLAIPGPIERNWAWLWTAHLAFAAAGAARFAGHIGAGGAPAVLAGVAYAASPRFLLAQTNGIPTLAMTAVYLPWILAGIRRAEGEPRRGFVEVSTFLGLGYLASPPSHVHVPLYVGLAYAVGRIPFAGLAAARAALLVPCVAAVGFALSAVQNFPAAEAGGLSTRAGAGYEWAVAWAAAPRDMVLWLSPGAIRGAIRSMVMPFVGATPLAAAPAALVRGRRAEAIPLLAVLAFSVAASLGDALPVYRLAVYPFFPMLRAPSRLLDGAVLAAALLGALGSAGLAGAVTRRVRRAVFSGPFVLAVTFALASRLPLGEGRGFGLDSVRWAAAAVSIIPAAPAARLGGAVLDAATATLPALLTPPPPPPLDAAGVDRALRAVPPGGRVIALEGLASPLKPPMISRAGRRSLLTFVALVPSSYSEGLRRRLGGPAGDPSADFSYGMIPFGRIDEAALGRWAVGWLVRPGAVVAEPNPAALPRAYVVSGGRADPTAVRIVRDEAEAIDLEVRAAVKTLLVLADQDYPGWVAEVDGVAVPIRRVEDSLRGVDLAAGARFVRFRYRPRSFLVGAVLSSLAAAGLLATTRRDWPIGGGTSRSTTSTHGMIRS